MPGEDEARASLPDDVVRAKVLVVGDVPANLALAQAIVEPLDCDVVAVQNGREALEALEALGRESFAVLLLDVQMPGMDGYEVARRVRLKRRGLTEGVRGNQLKENARLAIEAAYEVINVGARRWKNV